ncbi:hypothetical protein ANN_10756 [Periplaneta americana]|uniref:Tc1-like transposase DDE domain-containing protein n=1 Tax=Periplaneta americana TaxID=6978 RepID=A0ABQ8T369_PERAM|nr:hypothetical protein ANN_10756 [Periplaneta americana]
MDANVALVRSLHGRSCNEIETLAQVLGSCQHGELLRNSRHHNIRKVIEQGLRERFFEVHEEVHCVASEGGGIRRVNIVALDKTNNRAFILDPTVRFEMSQTQPSEVNKEKQQIYEPTIPYFREKYQMEGHVTNCFSASRTILRAYYIMAQSRTSLPVNWFLFCLPYDVVYYVWIDFDWRNVIFFDEVIVSNSTALVYCMNGHQYDERFVRRTINKSGCVRVESWGWMSYDGAGLLERIHERFTAEGYEHILANIMIPSARKRYPEGRLFFQQNNHPIHTANRIQIWFTRKRDVDPVDWPPNSPDMNPIQNLWAAVKRILRSNWAEQPPFRTPEELWDRVLDAWEEMAKNLDLIHNLVDSMPRRMRAVVDAGGLWTRY